MKLEEKGRRNCPGEKSRESFLIHEIGKNSRSPLPSNPQNRPGEEMMNPTKSSGNGHAWRKVIETTAIEPHDIEATGLEANVIEANEINANPVDANVIEPPESKET
jgi:hypothetical protein